MRKFTSIVITFILLSACGSQPSKPQIDHTRLIAALIAQNNPLIKAERNKLKISTKNRNIINLYQLTINDKPYEVISNSQVLLKNLHHYNLHQQIILKQLLLWAYAHPIYRQETAKQIRILQRESLLVAPSQIDFLLCESENDGCSNALRAQVSHVINPKELTEILTQMAENDPCINLSDENLAGDFGNQCLASRKGDLKINLISKPQFLFDQWQAIFDAQVINTP
ncbi:hypothetical protein [Marinicella litoralis]|uniref:Uncharacterized protein n=1 Tax=Marinicella litoralis TaxID=644220 RepID=A0A4V6PXZ7_9GAMM|nr:hypothetical protein [Marinicella litoralis]TDR23421.1 hypothetical protein C8D91_0282 [Marinicella litoralis]